MANYGKATSIIWRLPNSVIAKVDLHVITDMEVMSGLNIIIQHT